MNHQGTKRIETARLVLRPMTLEDSPAMYRNWASQEEVTRYLRWPTHESEEVTRRVLQSWVKSYGEKNFYQWGIAWRENPGEVLGTISVVEQDDRVGVLHIGYCIGKAFWGQGITSEAFQGILPFLFEEVGTLRIEAQHDPRNPRSGHVMKSCGLTYEGTFRQRDWNNQGICDASMYALLASDYQKQKKD